MDKLENFFTFVQQHRWEILEQTYEHIWITSVALLVAIAVGITAGILLTRYHRMARPVLGFVNMIQTIPSVALLGFLLPFFGIGVMPAIIALFLYALLPIVRNTYTGIEGVDPAVVEAARGLGMSGRQILRKVELPLATPVIFAGIRTAMVINIGVATLCALIAAGGLGEYIFRGIAVNNINMILAGAIPASLLAILLDAILSLLQRYIKAIIKPMLIIAAIAGILIVGYTVANTVFLPESKELIAGFNSEFMEREDGYPGFTKTYGFRLNTKEMEIGLMYEALHNRKVDVISGFSTDGRIQAYDLRVLEDDLHYFPPYYAAPLVREETLEKYPQLQSIFEQLAGKISEEEMMQMNYAVDQEKKVPREVARDFLKRSGVEIIAKRAGSPHMIIGSKNFTENFILAEMFAALIESSSYLTVGLELGFGGTKLLMDAIKNGDIDMYPEYTGTGLLVLLQPEKEIVDSLIRSKEVFDYVKRESSRRFELAWLQPLGFNNTTAMMMREDQADKLNIQTISDLKKHVQALP